MSSAYWSSADLKGLAYGGHIHEEVMDKIHDISKIRLPFMDSVGKSSTGNSYTEWMIDKLREPNLGGWVMDGADSNANHARAGSRIGNQCGILTQELQVTERASSSNTIGRSNELAWQVMRRQSELRRDVEANALANQGSQADNGDATPGIPASYFAQAKNFSCGVGGSVGAFANGVWPGVTPGTKRALTESMVRDALQAAYEDNADPNVMMSVPAVTRKFSEYCFTSTARIASLQRQTSEVGEGEAATAVGAVNVFISDFGQTVTLQANRLQRSYQSAGGSAGDAAAVAFLDAAYVDMCYLKGFRVAPLAKTGLAEKRHIAVDWTVRVLSPESQRTIMDIDHSAAVAAGMSTMGGLTEGQMAAAAAPEPEPATRAKK